MTRQTENGTLVRTNLSAAEYAEIRKLAIDRKQPVSQVTGDHLRKLLGGKR